VQFAYGKNIVVVVVVAGGVVVEIITIKQKKTRTVHNAQNK